MFRLIIALWFITNVDSAEDQYDADCADNPGNFQLWNGKMQTCSWAGDRADVRCDMNIVKRECPVTCGECKTRLEGTCADYDKYFQVWIKGKTVWRRCLWVGKDKKRRCRMRVPSKMCPATCGFCPSIPTESPTVQKETPANEIQNCSDTKNEFLINNNLRTCEWVATKLTNSEQSLCGQENVLRHCPMTCGYCRYDPNSSIIQNDMQWYDQNLEPMRAARCGSISTPKIDGYYYMVGSEPSKIWVSVVY